MSIFILLHIFTYMNKDWPILIILVPLFIQNIFFYITMDLSLFSGFKGIVLFFSAKHGKNMLTDLIFFIINNKFCLFLVIFCIISKHEQNHWIFLHVCHPLTSNVEHLMQWLLNPMQVYGLFATRMIWSLFYDNWM